MKVRLTGEVIAKLKHPNNALIKRGLMMPLGIVNRVTLWHKLCANEWNGDLTKESVLQYLESALGMTHDQLLETIDE